MKAFKTLIFIFFVLILLGIGWYLFPAEGLSIGNFNLRFPSYAESRSQGQDNDVNVDAVLDKVNKSFEMSCSENVLDSIRFFRD